MSEAAKSSLLDSGLEAGGRFAVLLALAHFLRPPDPHAKRGEDPDIVRVSSLSLAYHARLSVRQVKNILNALREEGLIERTHTGGAGQGDTHGYRLPFLDLIDPAALAKRRAHRTVYAGLGRAVLQSGLSGAKITGESVAKMVLVSAWAVWLERHEEVAKTILAYGGLAVSNLMDLGCNGNTLNKGEICRFRVKFETAKGEICDTPLLLLDSRILYRAREAGSVDKFVQSGPLVDAARTAAGQICTAIEAAGRVEEADGWLTGMQTVELVFADSERLGQPDTLRLCFQNGYAAQRFGRDFGRDFGRMLRETVSSWSGQVQLWADDRCVDRWPGRGDVGFLEMGKLGASSEGDAE